MDKKIIYMAIICGLLICGILGYMVYLKLKERGKTAVQNGRNDRNGREKPEAVTDADTYGLLYQCSNNEWLPNTISLPGNIGRIGCYLAPPTNELRGIVNGNRIYLNNGQGAEKMLPGVYRVFFRNGKLILSAEYCTADEDEELYFTQDGTAIPPIVVREENSADRQLMEVELENGLRLCVCGVWFYFEKA